MIYTIEQIKSKIEPILESYGVKKAYLFGSYAKDMQTDGSDIDIMIDSGGQLKGLNFVGLLEHLTTSLETDVDLFDSAHIEVESDLYKQVISSGITIYEKQQNRQKIS